MKRPNYLELLRALAQANAEFVVVGGVAAILRGAPVTTFDLDIVYSADADNLERLANPLARLDSRYRDPAGRSIVPTVARLRDNRVNLLATECGALDLRQEIGDGWGFQQTFARSTELSLEGFEIRVLELVSLIRAKEIADRPKDRVMLTILRETLRFPVPKHGDLSKALRYQRPPIDVEECTAVPAVCSLGIPRRTVARVQALRVGQPGG